jgi:ribose/xylose/arabinose/galactoside ABC-type transport system permease subunit
MRAQAAPTRLSIRAGRAIGAYPLISVGFVLIIAFALVQPRFLTADNIINVLIQASVLLIAATGMTYVVLTAGVDLSIGALMFLAAAMISAGLTAGLPPLLVVLAIPFVTLLLGAFNGTVIAKAGVPAVIVTLATLQVFRGAGGHLTEQRSLVLSADVRFLGYGDVAGVPRSVLVAAAVVLLGAYVLRRTRFGRHVQALGSNRSAARNAGLAVGRIEIAVYALAGLCAGIAALVQVGRLGAVQPTLDVGFELTVIAAVVLGGASLSGGRGGVGGTALGALLLVIVENGLVLSRASPYIFDIVRGAVLLAAIVGSGIPERVIRAARRRGEVMSRNPSVP